MAQKNDCCDMISRNKTHVQESPFGATFEIIGPVRDLARFCIMLILDQCLLDDALSHDIVVSDSLLGFRTFCNSLLWCFGEDNFRHPNREEFFPTLYSVVLGVLILQTMNYPWNNVIAVVSPLLPERALW